MGDDTTSTAFGTEKTAETGDAAETGFDGGDEPPVPEIDPTVSKTVTVAGSPITVDAATTAGDLKEMVDASPHDIATFRDGDEVTALSDDELVVKHVPDGATIRFQPLDREKDTFG